MPGIEIAVTPSSIRLVPGSLDYEELVKQLQKRAPVKLGEIFGILIAVVVLLFVLRKR